jgi:hypothetical protein
MQMVYERRRTNAGTKHCEADDCDRDAWLRTAVLKDAGGPEQTYESRKCTQ